MKIRFVLTLVVCLAACAAFGDAAETPPKPPANEDAIGFIFAVHFFNGHRRPGKFPMDLVIFTGSVDDREFRVERAAEFERLRPTGALESRLVAAPSQRAVRRGRFVGAIGLTLGLALFALIVYAVVP